MIIVNVIPGSPEWHALRYGVVTASDARCIIQPGALPRAPRWFRLTDAGLVERFRGSVQKKIQLALLALVKEIGGGLDERDIPGGVSTTLLTMLERGQIVEVDPPDDVEPVQAPLKVSAQRDAYMHRLLAESLLQRPMDRRDEGAPFHGTYWTERGHEGEGPAADVFGDITGLTPRAVGFCYKDESRTVGCSPDWGIFEGDEMTATAEVKNLAENNHIAVLLGGDIPAEHVPQVQFQSWVTGVPGWFISACPPEPDDVVRLPPLIKRVDPDPRWHAAFDEHVPAFVSELAELRARLIEMGAVPALD